MTEEPVGRVDVKMSYKPTEERETRLRENVEQIERVVEKEEEAEAACNINAQRTAVDRAGDERNLEQGRQLLLLLDRGLGVHKAALIADRAIAADEHVAGDRLAKHFDAEHVGDDLLRLLVEVGVHERDIVVACNAVAKRRQALLDATNLDIVGQRVAQVLQLLVGGGGRHQETILVAWRQRAAQLENQNVKTVQRARGREQKMRYGRTIASQSG